MSYESSPETTAVTSPTSEAPSSAPTTQAAPVSAPQTTSAAAPSQPQATHGGGEPQVPSYRLRQQREQYEHRINQIQAEANARFEQVQRQLHSLVGVNPPANPEVDAIKAQFGQLYGDSLAKLADPRVVERLLAMQAQSEDLQAQNEHYWKQHGRQTLNTLFSKAEETLGGPLTEAGKQQLHSAFVGYVQNDPDNQARYANDPSIVQDFWKAFSSNLIDPVRRSSQAAIQDRAPGGLPLDSPSGAPRATPAPQPASLDERMNLAWSQYNKFGQTR